MSDTEGRKRLQPKMGRGSWQFGTWAYSAQVVGSALLAVNQFTRGLNNGWDIGFFCLCAAWFFLSAGQVLNMLRVRRNDAPFWDEEEVRRRILSVGADNYEYSCSVQGNPSKPAPEVRNGEREVARRGSHAGPGLLT